MKTRIHLCGRHVARWVLSAFAALAILGSPTVARAQLTIQSITPTAITNTPGSPANYTITYSWPDLTHTATGAVMTITVPSPVQNTASNNIVLVTNPQITNAFYNPTNQTISYQFVNPLAAGSAGTVQFQAALRNDGTVTNGASANFGVTFSALGQTPATTNATLTASGVLDNATLSKAVAGNKLITTNATITYQLAPRNANPSLNITNWTMLDTLPPNVIYLSSSPPGTATTNGNVVSVTWTTNSFPADYKPTFSVSAYAPAASFNTGFFLTNRAWTTNLFLDGNTVVAGTTNRTALTAPTVSFDQIAKSSANWNGLFNSSFTWSVAWRARGNDSANSLTITDPLPAAYNLTAINPGFAAISPTTVYVQYQTNNNVTWLSLPGSPFTTTNGTDANSQTYYTTNLHLTGSRFVSSVRWIYTNVGPLMAFGSGDAKPTITGTITNIDHTGATVLATDTITNFATLAASYFGTNIALGTVSNAVTLAAPAPLISLTKTASAGNPTQPGLTNTWTLKLANGATASDNLTNPATADLLPLNMQYVPGSATGAGGNLSLFSTNVLVTTNYSGTGRTLVKFQYLGYLKPGGTATTTIQTYLSSGVKPGTITNDYSLIAWTNTSINSSSPLVADTNNLTGNTNTLIPTTSGNLTNSAAAVASSQKTIKGELDSAYQAYPLYGSSYPGGPFSYRETVSNPGNVTLTNITVIDILPYVGDVGVQVTNQTRGSSWQPFLTGPVSGPSGVTVYYSTSSNPYRPEILGAATPGSAGDWTTTLPTDLSTVRALKFAFGPTNVLNPLDSVQLTWTMQVPIAASTNTFAYNSFAYTATPAVTNTSPLISEPNKVGILAKPLQPAYLGDYVWNDVNADGIQNDGNTGLNGVRVELYLAGPSHTPNSPDDTFLQFVLTAAGPDGNPGYYQFPYLTNGNYFVHVVAPANYAVSPANQGSNTNLNSKFDVATGWSSMVTLATGQTNESVDCGLIQTATGAIGDYAWIDRNGDGLQNEGSIDGLNGVTVNLYQVTGTTNLYKTTTTAFDTFGNPGYYHFYNLPVGNYQLQFVPPPGDTFTTREANGANTGSGSEANSAGLTAVFSVTAGSVNNTWDAGIILPTGPYSIGNMVWYDPNADGRYDFFGGERGLNNVIVDLYYDTDKNGSFTPGTDQLFSSTLTSTIGGEPGNYAFNNLPSTNYVVVLDAINFEPGGALYGLTNDPSVTAVSPGYVDNLNKGTPAGSAIASSGFKPVTSTTAVDFGLTSQTNLFSVGDTVFYDTNGNGKQDAGETGVSGSSVQLYQTGPSGVVGGSDATLVTSTNTDASGFYAFVNLPPTNYFIALPTPPASAQAASPVVYLGNVTNGLNHGVQPGGFGTVVYGPSFYLTNNDVTEDFGFYDTTGLVAVGNTIFQDLNANGVQDAGETGISGVGLALAKIVAGITNVVAYTTSDTNGHYLFDLLTPANYQVVVLATNFGPAGPLTNLLSSPGANSSLPTNNYAISDHGVDIANPAVNGLRAAVYNLLVGTAPAPATNATPTEVPATNAHVYVDFGFYQPVTIGDYVWHDANGNGVQDDGGVSAGLAGVGLTLSGTSGAGGVVTAYAKTDANGYYQFTQVPGTYVVSVDATNFLAGAPLRGYVATATGQGTAGTDNNGSPSGTTPATLTSGGSDQTVDFGYYQPVSIGNFVWNDLNGNGVQDAGELGIAGVTLTLSGTDALGNPVTDHATTGVNGQYSFTEAPGTYTVTVDAANTTGGGALVGYAASVTGRGTTATDSNVNPSGTTPATLTSGGSDQTIDFGYYQPVSIGNFVWSDTNGNGVQDAGELGIAGVTLTLTGTSGAGVAVTDHATTGVNGQYSFTEAPGTYTVTVDAANTTGGGALVGYTATATGKGTTATDSNGNPSGTTPGTLASGGSDQTVDFGYYQVVTIGNFVWSDTNGNGVQDAGELGIAGVTLTLSGTNGAGVAVTDHATTGVNGQYSFTEAPGTYTVTVDAANTTGGGALVGYTATATGKGTTATDSNGNPSGTTPGTLASGGSDQTIDFGYYQPVSIGNFVWSDTNGNGVQDAGELGIAGVTLTLRGTSGAGAVVTDHATTGVNGQYAFTEAPGTYTVTVDAANATGGGALVGYTATATGKGTTATDSNVNPSGTTPGTLASGGSDQTVDFGYYQPVSIGDFVWVDTNRNGVQDSGEPGLGGVTVVLYRTNSGLGTLTAVATNVTAANGAYAFTNQGPGDFVVGFNLPGGYGYTLLNAGGDFTLDSDARTNGQTAVFTLTSGQSNTTIDAGLVLMAAFGNLVFDDNNGNGVFDAGDVGSPNVTVDLYTNGQVAGVSVPVASVDTDINGHYYFDNLAPGTYFVHIPADEFQAGGHLLGHLPEFTTFGGDNQNHGIYDSHPELHGISSALVVLAIGTQPTGEDATGYTGSVADTNSNFTIDIGTVPPAGVVSIGDTVFVDLNNNGHQDTGELGINGVTIELWKVGAGPGGTDLLDETQLTANLGGNDGSYLFDEPPGTYYVKIPASNFAPGGPLAGLPQASSIVLAGNGNNKGVQAGGNGTAAVGAAFTLTINQDNFFQDFGFTAPVTIGDYVWNDANGNGVQDAGETGIVGVTLTLTGTDGAGHAVSATTTTDAAGHYQFTEVPGTYTVAVVTPAGYVPTATGKGTAGTDSNANPSTRTLASGGSDLTIDFGFYQPVTIGDYVWNDANGNGVQDDGGVSAGFANVGLTLNGTNGAGVAVTAYTLTDTNGYYQFTQAPGTYLVSVDATNFLAGAPLHGYVATATGQGTVGTDSNASPSGTTPGTLAAGQSDETLDFGFTLPATVGDYVWNDVNGDGVQNVNEPPLANVRVFADLNQDGVWQSNEPMVLTDIHGHYYLSNLVAGTYQVRVDTNTLPAYATPTYDLDGLTTTNVATVTLIPGQVLLTVDFGYRYANPTLALLKSITATVVNGEAVIQWQTASEVDTLAYDLYRQSAAGEWLLVTTEPVLALNSITGGTYSTSDATARIPGTYTYKLVEWRLDGTEHVAGTATLSLLPPVRITSVVRLGNAMQITWEGGVAPYRLEQSGKLNGVWTEVVLEDTGATSVVLPLSGTLGFFRITNAQ